MGKRNSMPSIDFLHEILRYEDGKLYWTKKTAQCVKIGNEAGCNNGKGYITIPIQYKHYYAHRIIYMMHYKFDPYIVDHIDGNKQNNRIENLRSATHTQNSQNQGPQKNNTSGAKNVYWHKNSKKWKVAIGLNNKCKYIGTFEDFELAKIAAYNARIKYHGEYAKH